MLPPKHPDTDEPLPKVGVFGNVPPCDVFLYAGLSGIKIPAYTLLSDGRFAADRYADPAMDADALQRSIDKRVRASENYVQQARWQVIVNNEMLELLRDDRRFVP